MSEALPLHVTSETRTVYRSARGWRLTRHAAYVGAAKVLIAKRCSALDSARLGRWMAACEERRDWELPQPGPCDKDGDWQCRFHKRTEAVYSEPGYEGDVDLLVEGGMLHYRRVLDRLVRFLKFVDGRREEG